MLFNSFHFLVFFPFVVILYFIIPDKWRWLLLLIASYYFYMCWRAEYALIIMGITVLDYGLAILIDNTKSRSNKRYLLIISILSNFGILFLFKYFNFFNENIHSLLNEFNIFYDAPYFNLLLPIGLSFHTFQSVSYTIDVYYGNTKPVRHFGKYALFVSFFPQLVAGPIERATTLLPQFFQKHKFEFDRLTGGLLLIVWGFFKKLVIADRLAIFADVLFTPPIDHYGLQVIVGTFFFAIQIYCDFSGYTDIAIGAAKIMGYDLSLNFKRPYFANSFTEFWKRWHISLSSWFKDYLYIPLGGNRVVKWRWHYNLIITFLISGIWHGANWTFVVWGLLHGIYLSLSHFTRGIREYVYNTINLSERAQKLIHTLIVFAFVCFAWIFFRAQSIENAWMLIINAFVIKKEQFGRFMFNAQGEDFVLGFIFIVILFLIDFLYENRIKYHSFFSKSWIKYGYVMILIFIILLFGKMNSQEFIYFQF